MQMVFDVGVYERHQVLFTFNKMWGNLSITVDGVSVVDDLITVSAKLVRRYDFVVGINERHNVRVEKHRKLLLAGFRPQDVLAYVDGQLVARGVV